MTFMTYIACLIAVLVASISVNLILSGTIIWSGVIGGLVGVTAVYLVSRWRSGNQQPATKE